MRFIIFQENYQDLLKRFPAASGIIERVAKKKEEEFNRYPNSYDFNRGMHFIPEIKEFIRFVDTEPETYADKLDKIETNEDIPEFTYTDDKGKEKVSVPKLAEYLIEKYNFKTVFGKKDELVYVYNEGIYEARGKEIIKTKTEELLDWKCLTRVVNEVLDKIKRKTAIGYDEFEGVPDHLVCLKNGIFDLKKKELMNFNPDYYFKSKLPIRYDKNADADKILNFLKETCYPEDIPVIQEWFGFCLYRRYFIKKAIILFGEKNTGKTVLLNILNRFIGEKNTSGISLQKISAKDKFSLSFLKDKYTNCYDDLSADDLSDSGGFKIATGGGYITAEHKFGDSFQFKTYAKHIFATNTIPSVKDINDDAYYERWIPIPFDNQVEKKDMDNFLFTKLTTEEEMSGLFNWAMDGLTRLLTNGFFSYNKTSEEIKIIMQRQNNPLVAFCDEVLEQKDGNKISKEVMYGVYSKWCQKKSVPRLSKEQLGRKLYKFTSYMIAKGGAERVWENVIIKPEYSGITL